jgi:hypothetical protein
VAVIEAGAYDAVEISSGSQGMERIDLIVARYTKDAETNVEDMQIVAIEGTPASSNPAAPSYNEGDIQAGDSPVDMPLYQVNISGISIDSCTLVAQSIKTQAEADSAISGLQSAVSALNGKLPDIVIATETTKSVNVTLSPSSGTLEYVDISIPSGYKILCNCNVTANGITGVFCLIDGSVLKSNRPGVYIFNASSSHRSGNVTLRVYTLFIKNNL